MNDGELEGLKSFEIVVMFFLMYVCFNGEENV